MAYRHVPGHRSLVSVSDESSTRRMDSLFFFFNDTATTEIYTLSLHDALPIFHERHSLRFLRIHRRVRIRRHQADVMADEDRKSTRLNSSHSQISYAVFCLKKKNKHRHHVARLTHPRALAGIARHTTS